MPLWVKLRKGDASPHDHGYAAKHHSFIYPFIQPPNISLTLTVCQILGVSMGTSPISVPEVSAQQEGG